MSRKRPLPTIPEPYQDLKSLHTTCMALKEAVELLAGQRGNPEDVAVTWSDLAARNIIKKEDVPNVGSDRA